MEATMWEGESRRFADGWRKMIPPGRVGQAPGWAGHRSGRIPRGRGFKSPLVEADPLCSKQVQTGGERIVAVSKASLVIVWLAAVPAATLAQQAAPSAEPFQMASAAPDTSRGGRAAAPAAAAPVVQVGSGGGLRVSSPDGGFEIHFSAKLQGLYQRTAAPDNGVDLPAGGVVVVQPLPETQSLFRMRRGRLAFDGHVFDARYQYKVQLEMVGASLALKDAYVNWRMSGQAFQVEAGQFKVPFGRQELTSIFKQRLVDRSLVSAAFTHSWDTGVMVWGRPADGRLEYYLGVFNGEGINRSGQQDATDQWAGRLVWAPLGAMGYDGRARPGAKPSFALGVNANVNGGWLYDVNGQPGVTGPTETCTAQGCVVDHGDDARIVTRGADIAVRWGRFAGTAEAFARTIDPREPGLRNVSSRGWFAEAGGLATERLEAGFRVGRLTPDAAAAASLVEEIAPYVDAYVRGDALKLQADYTLTRTHMRADPGEAGSLTSSRRLRVQLVFAF